MESGNWLLDLSDLPDLAEMLIVKKSSKPPKYYCYLTWNTAFSKGIKLPMFRLTTFIDAATCKLVFHPSWIDVPVSLKTNGEKVCQSQQEVRPITIEDIVSEKKHMLFNVSIMEWNV